MKLIGNKYLLELGVVILVATALVILHEAVRSQSPVVSTPTPSGFATLEPGAVLTMQLLIATLPKTVDLAPKVPEINKATIIIQHSDGTREAYLLTTDMIDTFIKQLPNGDTLDTIIPPQALMGHVAPVTIPAPGNQTYSGTPTIIGTPPSEP